MCSHHLKLAIVEILSWSFLYKKWNLSGKGDALIVSMPRGNHSHVVNPYDTFKTLFHMWMYAQIILDIYTCKIKDLTKLYYTVYCSITASTSPLMYPVSSTRSAHSRYWINICWMNEN